MDTILNFNQTYFRSEYM